MFLLILVPQFHMQVQVSWPGERSGPGSLHNLWEFCLKFGIWHFNLGVVWTAEAASLPASSQSASLQAIGGLVRQRRWKLRCNWAAHWIHNHLQIFIRSSIPVIDGTVGPKKKTKWSFFSCQNLHLATRCLGTFHTDCDVWIHEKQHRLLLFKLQPILQSAEWMKISIPIHTLSNISKINSTVS